MQLNKYLTPGQVQLQGVENQAQLERSSLNAIMIMTRATTSGTCH
jgi:hypothetical protein